jgi:ADP-heptose:LPS heptosyltransferase
MKNLKDKLCRTLFIYHPGALGDALFLYPVLRIFRETHPNAKIVAIGGEPWRLLSFLGWVDETFSCHSRFVSEWFGKEPMSCPIELRGPLKPPLKAWIFLSHPPEGLLNWLSPLCLDPPVYLPVFPPSGHAVKFYARRLLGINHEGPWPELAPHPKVSRAIDHPVSPERSVIIHAGSGNPIKNLPLSWIPELCQFLKAQSIQPSLLAGPSEIERGLFKDLGAQEVPLLAPENLEGLYSLLKKHRAFVGTDSGPTHMASAMGLYTLAFFGPSDPKRFSIWGASGAVFWVREDCAPCMLGKPPQSCGRNRPCLLSHNPLYAAQSLKNFFDRG